MGGTGPVGPSDLPLEQISGLTTAHHAVGALPCGGLEGEI